MVIVTPTRAELGASGARAASALSQQPRRTLFVKFATTREMAAPSSCPPGLLFAATSEPCGVPAGPRPLMPLRPLRPVRPVGLAAVGAGAVSDFGAPVPLRFALFAETVDSS